MSTSAPGGADERDELAVRDPQRDVVHGGDSAGEDLRHAIERSISADGLQGKTVADVRLYRIPHSHGNWY